MPIFHKNFTKSLNLTQGKVLLCPLVSFLFLSVLRLDLCWVKCWGSQHKCFRLSVCMFWKAGRGKQFEDDKCSCLFPLQGPHIHMYTSCTHTHAHTHIQEWRKHPLKPRIEESYQDKKSKRPFIEALNFGTGWFLSVNNLKYHHWVRILYQWSLIIHPFMALLCIIWSCSMVTVSPMRSDCWTLRSYSWCTLILSQNR